MRIESGSVRHVEKRRKRNVFARKRQLVLEQPDLGLVKDKVIARRLGVSTSWVFQARKCAGIPACKMSDCYRQLVLAEPDLGEIPDQEIADRIGVSETTVWKYRQEARIGPSRAWKSHRVAKSAQPTASDINAMMVNWR